MTDPLALENRRLIFEHIRENPGTHIREMERDLKLSIGVLTYHLDQLENARLIRSEGENRRGYFKADDFTHADRRFISILRSKRVEQIVVVLLEKESVSFRELKERLDISNSTLSYHMSRLVRSEIATMMKVNREKYYRLIDKDSVLAALVTIEKTEDPVGAFIEIWDEIGKMR
ncbi:MAG: winged helix-turn-helix transcriptional regulator [Methanomassiliicoccales archaeon]|jgi:predicted transcriptional regulator